MFACVQSAAEKPCRIYGGKLALETPLSGYAIEEMKVESTLAKSAAGEEIQCALHPLLRFVLLQITPLMSDAQRAKTETRSGYTSYAPVIYTISTNPIEHKSGDRVRLLVEVAARPSFDFF
jgi:hypothetical protein